MKKVLIVATRNAHKVQEIAAMLPAGYEVHSLADFPSAPEVEESAATFAGNAALKACGISSLLPGMVLADDSGLCVDALGGAPGVMSARYAGVHGDDAANNARLLHELAELPQPHTARFMCCMCVAEGGRVLAEFTGKVEGQITLTPAGEHGFGYDPLFVPAGYDCTMAQLSAEQKNAISHRADALQQFLAWAGSEQAPTA
ncbi:MAG: RdgB/HAM1 family non-canonical purine NTP pyrophosphatase [Akkermansia sp.]|nr:RdgB/HAM1 family non-canonical purine NTP pyrophosphatase [Akkermansia sp.]